MSKIIGIDLGTTNAAAAYLTDEGPRLLANVLGETLTPSVVGVDEGGQLLVGRTARELQIVHPERCATLFKRHMGSDWTADLQGRTFSPEELSSLVLRSLKADAEAFFGEPVPRAVITVPAYFNDRQRKATLNAGRIAGFQVERIFNEPTAAALAYGFHEIREDQVLLIFDLGGGTFDVSVVELFEGVLEVRASSGESFLGGEDFTRTLAARVLERHGQPFERTELEAPRLIARLIQQCELAKCRLSRQDSAVVRLPDRKGEFHDDSPVETVTRAQLETWTRHILARIELPIRTRQAILDRMQGEREVWKAVGQHLRRACPDLASLGADLLGKAASFKPKPIPVNAGRQVPHWVLALVLFTALAALRGMMSLTNWDSSRPPAAPISPAPEPFRLENHPDIPPDVWDKMFKPHPIRNEKLKEQLKKIHDEQKHDVRPQGRGKPDRESP